MRLPAPRTLASLAAELGGEVDEAARGRLVDAVEPIATASGSALAPLTSPRFLAAARDGDAALLVSAELAARAPEGRRWIHPHAGYALARLLQGLAPTAPHGGRGDLELVSPAARVDASATMGPGAVVLAGATIGPGARIEPNAVIYGNVVIGARAIVGAGSVVGRPGFGWVASPDGELLRVPQLGGVILEDDVEIGPLCTVDAGTLAPTVIRRGAKLDAHVHVGHNGIVGRGVLVAAQAGFAGSVEIGARARIGGQVGIADHVKGGAGAELAAKAGVIGDVPPGAVVAGYPAVERLRWLRGMARTLRDERGPRRRR